jgi:hypothetical protein
MSVENNERQQSAAEMVTKPSLLNEATRKVLHLISLSITYLKKKRNMRVVYIRPTIKLNRSEFNSSDKQVI